MSLEREFTAVQRDRMRAEAMQAHCERVWAETGKDVVIDRALWDRISKGLPA